MTGKRLITSVSVTTGLLLFVVIYSTFVNSGSTKAANQFAKHENASHASKGKSASIVSIYNNLFKFN